jgi:hypothetical protein
MGLKSVILRIVSLGHWDCTGAQTAKGASALMRKGYRKMEGIGDYAILFGLRNVKGSSP